MDIFLSIGVSCLERQVRACVCVFVCRGMQGVVVQWRVEEGRGGKRDRWVASDRVLEESGSSVIGS